MDEARNGNRGSSTSGSLRKRPFAESLDCPSSKLDRQPNNGEDDAMEFSPPPKYPAGNNAVLDEIELHFQRSLAQSKIKRTAKEVHVGSVCNTSSESSKLGDSAASKKSDCSEVSQTTTNTPTLSPSDNSGTSVVAVDSRELAVPPKPPQILRSPPLSDSSFGVVGSTNTTTQSVLQRSLQRPGNHSGEMVKVVPSRIVNPHSLGCGTTSPTGFKVSGTQSGTVQVIDLTRHSSTDAQVAKNGIASASPSSSPSLSDTSHHPKELLASKVLQSDAGKDRVSSVITRNGTSSTPTKVGAAVGNPVILLPTTPGNLGSTVMMQPQPYILVNPGAEMQRATLLGSPNVYCGTGSGYILLSPSSTVPNSLLQVVSSAGVCVPQSGVTTSVVPSSPLTLISAPKQPVTPLNSTKVACTSFVTDDSRKDDINVMPASVEDHFAKALGDQWSKLNTGSNVSSSSSTVKT